MADSSTTSTPILDLIEGDSWARRQLRSGITDMSVVSKLMKSLTLLGVVLQVSWRTENSIAGSSMAVGTIVDLIAGGCQARQQLRNGIRSIPPQPLFMMLQG